MPKRIQRKRTKGWKMPAGAVYVGRPTKWGNPYKIGSEYEWMNWVTGDWETGIIEHTATAVEQFRVSIEPGCTFEEDIQRELAGHDLACWCPLDQPCHADVLLEVANR